MNRVDEILIRGLDLGASDIHVTTMCELYYRVDGRLIPDEIEKGKIYKKEEVEEMTKDLLGDKYEEFLKARQLDTSYAIPGKSRFRVNAYFQRGSISLTLRTIKSEPPTTAQLNLPSVFKKFVNFKNGLVLITGATGSGKTTTMAAIINEINRTKEYKIVTLEDPIEFVFRNDKSLITQREVGADVNSFADGLKAMLRQDPDVIVAGELRTMETIEMALTAAETGHLVLATLHTNSAISSIERMLGVFPPEQQEQIKLQLSKSLRGVCSQYLLPTRAGGRVLATEILIPNKGIANLIRENKLTQIPNMMKMGRSEGMMIMNDCLDNLVKEGKIAPEVAEAHKVS